MAEETLVKEALTDEMIEKGASVVEALDKRSFLVDAALWFYLSDLNRWPWCWLPLRFTLKGRAKL
jgi:hypothetical protein